MFGKLGKLPSISLGVVIVAVAAWAIYTQTDLFRSAPVVEASDTPIAVAVEDNADQNDTANQDADQDAVVADATEAADETGGDEPTVEDSGVSAEEATTTESDQPAPEVAAVVIPAPAFDVVRVESDGMTVIAGTGPAGWMVSILVDGVEVETVKIDATGQFAAFLDIGNSETARVITLSAKNGDEVLLSDAQVIIAPVMRKVAEVVVEDNAASTEAANAATEAANASADAINTSADEAATATANAMESVAGTADQGVDQDTAIVAETPVSDALSDTAIADEATTDVTANQAANQTTETQSVGDVVVAEDQTVDMATTDTKDETSVVETSDITATDETVGATTETSDAIETLASEDPVQDNQASASANVAEDAAAATPLSEAANAPAVADTAVDTTTEPAVDETLATPTPEAPQSAPTTEASQPVVTASSQTESKVADTNSDEAPANVEAVEQAAPAVLLVDNDGVKVLQPASQSPQVMDQLSISAISYSEDGAVQLSGLSPSGFLRVYLNNIPIMDLEVLEPGEWHAELANVAPGIYTLRVDQLDANGDVVQRVETPFKREEPQKVVDAAQTRKPLASIEVVQPGSTLWAISRANYGSGVLFVRIFEANKDQIRNPDLIYPGQIFELPAPPGAKKKKRTSGQ